MKIKKNLKNWISVICILLSAGMSVAYAGQSGEEGKKDDHAEKKAKGIAVNSEAPDFTLTDVDGKTFKLSQFDGKIVVLEWANYDCPFVKAHYVPEKKTTTKLAQKYEDKDVVWLVINSTHYTTAKDSKEWAEKVGLEQTVLIDTDGKVGKLYHAKTTPHLYVVDKKGRVVYQGAIDNAPLGNVPEGKEFVNYVDQALSELIADKEVSVPRTKPYGCTVKYPPNKDKK